LYLDEINCIDYGVREVYMLYAGIHWSGKFSSWWTPTVNFMNATAVGYRYGNCGVLSFVSFRVFLRHLAESGNCKILSRGNIVIKYSAWFLMHSINVRIVLIKREMLINISTLIISSTLLWTDWII
jgi:hypothetical protein